MPQSPRKRRRGSDTSWHLSSPPSPSTLRSPPPPVLEAGQITAEDVSQDGSRSVGAIQFPGAVLLRYSHLGTGELHVRAGGARAAAAALEPGRFDVPPEPQQPGRLIVRTRRMFRPFPMAADVISRPTITEFLRLKWTTKQSLLVLIMNRRTK